MDTAFLGNAIVTANEEKMTDMGADPDQVEKNAAPVRAGVNIVSLAIMIIAGWIAWDCNKKETQGLRIIYTLLAAMFGTIYLFYYVIRYGLMGHECYSLE